MVSALSFHDFAGFRFFVDFNLARLAGSRLRVGNWGTTTGLRIEQVDNVFQAVAILGKQGAKLGFKFDFLLQASITFEGFEGLKLLGEVFFKLAKFSEFGHVGSLRSELTNNTPKPAAQLKVSGFDEMKTSLRPLLETCEPRFAASFVFR